MPLVVNEREPYARLVRSTEKIGVQAVAANVVRDRVVLDAAPDTHVVIGVRGKREGPPCRPQPHGVVQPKEVRLETEARGEIGSVHVQRQDFVAERLLDA